MITSCWSFTKLYKHGVHQWTTDSLYTDVVTPLSPCINTSTCFLNGYSAVHRCGHTLLWTALVQQICLAPDSSLWHTWYSRKKVDVVVGAYLTHIVGTLHTIWHVQWACNVIILAYKVEFTFASLYVCAPTTGLESLANISKISTRKYPQLEFEVHTQKQHQHTIYNHATSNRKYAVGNSDRHYACTYWTYCMATCST